jgi:transposase
VLCVETIGKIRRRRLVDGESISAIARDLRLSRNTVKRVLRFEGEAYEYQRRRQPRPQLGPYLARLEAWLELEEKLPAREQRTAQRMYEALRLEGYAGAVDAVRRHMREFERRRHPVATAFIPQSFAPGEAYQFDWSHEHVELGGVDQVVKVAHVRLCHSRAFFLVAYPRESQEMVFDAHARAFGFLGGMPRRGIYDNLKPAVDAIFVGRERRYNRRFLVMCNHYLVDPTACTPAAGWEKGQVENQVGNVTQARDRKRMLRLLIKDITIEKQHGARHAIMHIRWQGGACSDVHVDLPRPRAEAIRYPEPIIARVRDLARTLTDRQIVAELNRLGELSATGRRHTMHTIKWIRWKYRIPAPSLKRPEEVTVNELAARLGVLPGVVYYWAKRGMIGARRLNGGSPVWITLDDVKMRELRDRVSRSRKMQKQSNV